MPFHSTVDRERGRGSRTWEGVVTAEEFEELLQLLANDESLAGLNWLVDMRNVELIDISPDELMRLSKVAHAIKEETAAPRSAIVVADDGVAVKMEFYAAARGVHAHAQRDVRVFRDIDHAEQWLIEDWPLTDD